MSHNLQSSGDFQGDLLSAVMLGCKADGVADNYAKLTAAINSASAAGSPGLRFHSGVYKVVVPVGGSITIPAGMTLLGDQGSEILMVDDGHTGVRTLFQMGGDNCGLKNLTLTVEIAIAPPGQNNVDVIQIGTANNVSIIGCHLNGSRDGGFQDTNGIQFVGDSDGVLIADCTFEQLWYGFYRAVATTTTQRDIRVNGSRFYRNFGDDANFNCPGANFSERDITVVGCSFRDNQSNVVTGGFGVSAANCSQVTISGCTFENYQREAVHIELSNFVSISGNTFKDTGLDTFGAMQIIATSQQLSVVGNTIDMSANVGANFGIAVQPGGVSPCSQVSVCGNTVLASATVTAIYVGSSNDLTCGNNVCIGTGVVSGGIYTGGSSTGIEIGGTQRGVVAGNFVKGFGSGIGSINTAIQVGDNVTISGNTLSDCNAGLAIKANGELIVIGNLIFNTIFPTLTGPTTVGPKNMTFVANRAIGCHLRMDVFDNSNAFNWLIALNFDDHSGATVGSTSILNGYSNTSGDPSQLVIGAGGAGSNAVSLAFGQGTGFQCQFGTRIGGVYVPVAYVDDLGNLIWVGSDPLGGIVAYKKGKFTSWVGAGVSAPLGGENFTTGFGGAVIQGSLALPNVVTNLPLFDNGPGNTIIGRLIDLTTAVVGVLPIGNGGTGRSGALTASSPVRSDASGVLTTGPTVLSGADVSGILAHSHLDGVTITFDAVSSFTTTTITYVTSVDFVLSSYTTNSTTVVDGLIVVPHDTNAGLVMT